MYNLTPNNAQIYDSVSMMFVKNKHIDPWRGKTNGPSPDGSNKESTEAMDVISFALIKEIILDKDEDLTPIPALIIQRLYTKAYTWDGKPENLDFFRDEITDFDAGVAAYVYEVMAFQGIQELVMLLKEEAGRISPKVKRAFDAARALSSLLEFEELEEQMRSDAKRETKERIRAKIREFSDLPHFLEIADGAGEYGKLKELLKNILASRFVFRWQGYTTSVKCSILEHMLESAVISYLMNLEKGDVSKEDMLKDFFTLMFHDLAEIWVDDIPGPIKDKVKYSEPVSKVLKMMNFHTAERVQILTDLVKSGKGVTLEDQRELLSSFDSEMFLDMFEKEEQPYKDVAVNVAQRFEELIASDKLNISELADLLDTTVRVRFRLFTEFQELKALEEHFYPNLPEKVEKFFRNGVMLEDVQNKDKKRFYKAADYFSADFEVFWNIEGGTREPRYQEILEESSASDSNRTDKQRELLKYYVGHCKKVAFF